MGRSSLWIILHTLTAAKQNKMVCRTRYILSNTWDLHRAYVSSCKLKQLPDTVLLTKTLILSSQKRWCVCRFNSPSCTICTPPRLNFTEGDVMETGGQLSIRNVAASTSSAVTLGKTSSSGPPGFQYFTPILQSFYPVFWHCSKKLK